MQRITPYVSTSDDMSIELLAGWRKGSTFRGEETYLNDQRKMIVSTSPTKSTLAKENEIYLEFIGDTHFSDALRRSDEIWAESYVNAN